MARSASSRCICRPKLARWSAHVLAFQISLQSDERWTRAYHHVLFALSMNQRMNSTAKISGDLGGDVSQHRRKSGVVEQKNIESLVLQLLCQS